MTIMATAALLLFEQGRFFAEGPGSMWPPQAGLYVGVPPLATLLLVLLPLLVPARLQDGMRCASLSKTQSIRACAAHQQAQVGS